MPRCKRRFIKGIILPVWFAGLALLLAACDQALPTTPTVDVTSTRATTPTPRASSSAEPRATRTPTQLAEPAEPTSELGIDADRLQGVEVQFWHAWTGEAEVAVRELVEDFNTNNEWGIAVQEAGQENLDRLSAEVLDSLEAGEAPDLVVGYLYQALSWGADGDVIDLGTYVNDPLWGLSQQEQEDFFPVFWMQDVLGERRVGIPAQRSGQFLYYNITWAEELGFDEPPRTSREFQQQACAAATANKQDDNPGNDVTGGYILSTDYSAILGWLYAFGGDILEEDGGGYRFDTPQAKETFTFLRSLYDQGCAWLPESESPEAEFAGRLGLFSTGSVMDLPYQAAAFERADSSDEWTVIPFPSPVEENIASAYGPSFEILASTPERQLAAWLFLKWLVAPQNQARFVEAAGSYPLQASTLDFLEEYQAGNPQWEAAVGLLSSARAEPSFQSWSLVRWTVYDAATQLFRYYFTIDQVPNLIKLLDQTAADLHEGGS